MACIHHLRSFTRIIWYVSRMTSPFMTWEQQNNNQHTKPNQKQTDTTNSIKQHPNPPPQHHTPTQPTHKENKADNHHHGMHSARAVCATTTRARLNSQRTVWWRHLPHWRTGTSAGRSTRRQTTRRLQRRTVRRAETGPPGWVVRTTQEGTQGGVHKRDTNPRTTMQEMRQCRTCNDRAHKRGKNGAHRKQHSRRYTTRATARSVCLSKTTHLCQGRQPTLKRQHQHVVASVAAQVLRRTCHATAQHNTARQDTERVVTSTSVASKRGQA